MDDSDQKIVEGDVVEEVKGGEILINMESMIKNHISSIDRIQEEMQKHKGMLDDIFANDLTFQEHDKIAKEATKVKQKTRSEILKRPQAKELSEKVRNMKSEIKEQQDALSDYLQEYQRLSGLNEIEGEDGQMRTIVYVAKLVRSSR